jgi:proteic killer suppression protein
MNVRFVEDELRRLATDPGFSGGWAREVVKAFRKRIQMILDAQDERMFRAGKSLHFERLEGKRSHQHSMKLNDQWRLILEFEGEAPKKVVVVVGIEDYH